MIGTTSRQDAFSSLATAQLWRSAVNACSRRRTCKAHASAPAKFQVSFLIIFCGKFIRTISLEHFLSSDARWHTLKLDQEMNQEDKFKEYKSAIISGAFLDDYFGLWALKMDISGKNDGMVWAKCGNGTNKTTNSSKLSTITTISALDTKSSELTTPGSKVKPGGSFKCSTVCRIFKINPKFFIKGAES